jgi:hypothetical protein
VLEICETGEQGGLIVGSESSVKLYSRKLHWVTFKSFNFQDDELLTENVAWPLLSGNCILWDVRMESSYLVDPASSHMLVSKIKPCMSKYKQLCTVKLRMAH